MGMTTTFTVHLSLTCDGGRTWTSDSLPCPTTLTLDAESLAKAVLAAKAQGWSFRYPHAACPACRLPEVPSGRATIIKE